MELRLPAQSNRGSRLVAYARVSSVNKALNEDSPEAQLEACRRWAGAEGHEIVAEFIDNGISGRVDADDRPGLAACIVEVEDGRADGVVFRDLDRLARELHVQEMALRRVWNAGGQVFSSSTGEVHEDDPTDPGRTMVRQIMGSVSQFEASMIRARLQRGRSRKHASGGYAGGPTVRYGERVEGTGRNAVRVKDLALAGVPQRMRELRAEGMTYAEIADVFNAGGVPTARGGRWHGNSVRRIAIRHQPDAELAGAMA